MDEHGIRTTNDILHVFTNEFNRRFKKDLGLMVHQAISFSRDMKVSDNDDLVEIYRGRSSTSDQLNHLLKAPGLAGMHAIFYQKC